MEVTNPQSESILNRRKSILLALFIAVVAILLGRLFSLQVIRHEHYSRLALSNRIQRERILAPRGLIRARDGSKLVVNVPVYQINILPREVRNDWEKLTLACRWLEIDEEKLLANLSEWKERYPDGREMPVVPAAAKHQISSLMENRALFPFFRLVMKHRRQYPKGDLASHVLGYVGEVTDAELRGPGEFHPGDNIGRTGIEYMYEQYLRGKDGVRIVEISAEGVLIGEYEGIIGSAQIEGFTESRPPLPGCDIYLTLDPELQIIVERHLQWDKGCVIAMDPRSGAVLAAASRPSYDPNIFLSGISAEDWKELNENPDKPLFNRSIQATYPPASTFKLMVSYAALEFDIVTRNERLESCYGFYRFGNRNFRCWKPEGHGSSNLFEAMVNSCDVYFYQLGERLEADQLAYAGRLFGLGRETGIDLPGEARGVIPDHSHFDRRFGKNKWTRGHLLNYSIGQGEVLVTPIQICQMTAMIANGGCRIRPHVVHRVMDTDGAIVYENGGTSVRVPRIDTEKVKFIERAMESVVGAENGTGRAAAVPGLRIAGKTGTAQNAGEDHALFVCYAPVEDPRIVLTVILENAGHGGARAAPLARNILWDYFQSPTAGNIPVRQAVFSLRRRGGAGPEGMIE